MEWLAVVDACGCVLESLYAAGVVADVCVWVFGRPNRDARREATQTGQPKPPLSRPMKVFLILTPILVILTVVIVWRYARGPN